MSSFSSPVNCGKGSGGISSCSWPDPQGDLNWRSKALDDLGPAIGTSRFEGQGGNATIASWDDPDSWLIVSSESVLGIPNLSRSLSR